MFSVRAPGRVNLIGEHTDYNDGYVLPLAIDREVVIRAELTTDSLVELTLAETGETASFDLLRIGPRRNHWIDYPAGVASTLGDAHWLGGLTAEVSSSLPMQAGLASSAAFELASALALLTSGGIALSEIRPMQLAQLCQRAENEYVGVACGLMDQFASACGVAGHALFLDCRSLDWRPIPIPSDLALVVVDTGARRRLNASEYNERRASCERGVEILVARGEPVTSLRDATLEMLDRAYAELGDVIYRRCRHVVEENARVVDAVDALVNGDHHGLGELFAASHASLRNQFEVSSAELDAAVEIATRTPGVVAARMTGAGFGGCTVNLVERGAVDALRDAIATDYEPLTGLAARVLEVSAVGGASYLS